MSINWQLSEPTAGVLNLPVHAVSLDEAHSAIELWEFYSRKSLDAAQKLSVEVMMAENAAGRWAVRSTGRCQPRQNGKGDEIEVPELWDLVQRDGAAIVHTAHEIPTAVKAHERLVQLLEGHRDLRRLIRKTRYAPGTQGVEMVNGGQIAYRTRTGSGARGLDDISRLVVDEAQHAQPEQLASSTPILAVNPNPQTNFVGSAGIEGKSEFWWRMRKAGLRHDPGSSWLEHTAELVSLDDEGRVLSMRPDPYDQANWRKSNTAFPHRIEPEFLTSQLAILGSDLFSREHMGVWDPESGADGAAIDFAAWSGLAVDESPEPDCIAVAIDVDRAYASIGASDGRHVGSVRRDRLGPWLLDEVVRIALRRYIPVVIDGGGPAASLIDDLVAADVNVIRASMEDYKTACADFVDAITAKEVEHGNYPELNDSVRCATWRMLGDRPVWARKNGDISMLEAVTLARWAALQVPTYDPVLSVG